MTTELMWRRASLLSSGLFRVDRIELEVTLQMRSDFLDEQIDERVARLFIGVRSNGILTNELALRDLVVVLD